MGLAWFLRETAKPGGRALVSETGGRRT